MAAWDLRQTVSFYTRPTDFFRVVGKLKECGVFQNQKELFSCALKGCTFFKENGKKACLSTQREQSNILPFGR